MAKSIPQSFLRKITHIEAIVRLMKDDFLREHLMPEINTVNLAKSELDSLCDFVGNKKEGCMNKTRKLTRL